MQGGMRGEDAILIGEEAKQSCNELKDPYPKYGQGVMVLSYLRQRGPQAHLAGSMQSVLWHQEVRGTR
jgi:hypothetical protein